MKMFPLLLIVPFITVIPQTDNSWKIFSDSSLVRIDITIDNAKLQWMYNNVQSDSEHVASFRFRNGLIDESVDSVGFRLRGNTSRVSKKKSFKVSFNSFIKGRDFHGLEKLNLNGEHNDPSIIRSKLSFDLFREIGLIASRANHARVYINGAYYGLYVSVEHVDEKFLKKNFTDDSGNLWKCLYPADLKYLGSNPDLYKNSTSAYDLITNQSTGDYKTFARFVNIVNNTPSNAFADSLENILRVYQALQYFAVNTLVGGWDDYRALMNNYYLYHDPSDGKFTVIPYDYDNTFGIDWFKTSWATADPYNYPKAVSGARPLWEKIMTNTQYRDLYTHFLRFYRERVYSLPLWEERLKRLKDSITIAALEDTYRTLDYGFTFADFQNSYSSGPYSKLHVTTGIREFVNSRNTSLANQLNYTNASPIAYRIALHPLHPRTTDSISITASCFGAAGIKEVSILYAPDGSGTGQLIPMFYAPVSMTKHVEENDRWTGTIPPLGPVLSGTFRIFIKDSLNQSRTYPRSGSLSITASPSAAQSVIINEFMADNGTIADPAGQFDDWVELYNPTPQPVLLTGKYLTDKASSLTKWRFTQPDLTIGPGQYLIVWCDEDQPQQGVHAGFKLSAGGEFLALTDSDGVTVHDSLSFGLQTLNTSYGRSPDGSTVWGTMNPTPLAPNSSITNVGRSMFSPDRFDLEIFPNPFNPTTTIQYWLPQRNDITIDIVDIMGRTIWTFAMKDQQTGRHSLQWNGTTTEGSAVSSGVYFVRVRNNDTVLSKKLLLLK